MKRDDVKKAALPGLLKSTARPFGEDDVADLRATLNTLADGLADDGELSFRQRRALMSAKTRIRNAMYGLRHLQDRVASSETPVGKAVKDLFDSHDMLGDLESAAWEVEQVAFERDWEPDQ